MADKRKLSNKEKREIGRAYTLITQIGIQMIVTILICLFAGKKLDEFFGVAPLFILVFLLLGILSCFKSIYDMGMRSIDKPEIPDYLKDDYKVKSIEEDKENKDS